MIFNTSYLVVDGIWKEILIIEGKTPPTDNIIKNKISDTTEVIYHTNGVYKTFVEGETVYTWYIINSKETIVNNPELSQKVTDLEAAIAELAYGGAK